MSEREGARDGNIGRASRGFGWQCAGAEVPPFYRLSDRHRERIVVDGHGRADVRDACDATFMQNRLTAKRR